jgi:hypothetical protein
MRPANRLKHKRSKLGFYDLMKSAIVVLETLMLA